MTTEIPVRYTPEDVLAMPDGHRFELIDGELKERAMSVESSLAAVEINSRLAAFARANRLGRVFQSDLGLRIYSDEGRLRYADGGFISNIRLAGVAAASGFLTVAPELVVEVVSPNDLFADLDLKVIEYLAAGVKLVWVLVPETTRVHIWRANGTTATAEATGALSGEDVLPGFSCAVSELFAA